MTDDVDYELVGEHDFILTLPELRLLEHSLYEKVEALSACFGVMPLGDKTKSLMKHRNDLLPLHAKIQRLRRDLEADTPSDVAEN